ncbi:DUF6221 family protein [Nocardia tengchongensis]|uniref:DUF6221 family protein n=1 Tax=Nocardia tengchongensis TaxID=2055889 RepID=UPI0036AFF80E
MTIEEFIEARLAEDETIARGAIDPNRPGTNWHWVVTHNGTPLPDGEEAQALDDGHHLSLRTLEEFPLSWDPPSTLPAFIIGADGGFPGGLRHIARQDPARELREVKFKRRVLGLHEPEQSAQYDDLVIHMVPIVRCVECTGDSAPVLWPCEEIRALAAVWSDHPDYRPEWAVDGGGP